MFRSVQSTLAVRSFNEESILMLVPLETNERMEIKKKSYQQERETRDQTKKLSGSHGQSGLHDAREVHVKEERKRLNIKT